MSCKTCILLFVSSDIQFTLNIMELESQFTRYTVVRFPVLLCRISKPEPEPETRVCRCPKFQTRNSGLEKLARVWIPYTQWSWVHSMFTRDVHDVTKSLPCRLIRFTAAGQFGGGSAFWSILSKIIRFSYTSQQHQPWQDRGKVNATRRSISY